MSAFSPAAVSSPSHISETALPAASPTERAQWFVSEVQPHGPSLKRYIRGAFPAVRDVEDVVQESYLRLWRARAAAPVRSAKALLFCVARHLAIDLVRHDRRSPFVRVEDLDVLSVAEGTPAVPASLERQEKVQLLSAAIDALPERCRTVVLLRKFELLPTQEVAARLGISERAVEKQLERGVERCRLYFAKHGNESFFDDGC